MLDDHAKDLAVRFEGKTADQKREIIADHHSLGGTVGALVCKECDGRIADHELKDAELRKVALENALKDAELRKVALENALKDAQLKEIELKQQQQELENAKELDYVELAMDGETRNGRDTLVNIQAGYVLYPRMTRPDGTFRDIPMPRLVVRRETTAEAVKNITGYFERSAAEAVINALNTHSPGRSSRADSWQMQRERTFDLKKLKVMSHVDDFNRSMCIPSFIGKMIEWDGVFQNGHACVLLEAKSDRAPPLFVVRRALFTAHIGQYLSSQNQSPHARTLRALAASSSLHVVIANLTPGSRSPSQTELTQAHSVVRQWLSDRGAPTLSLGEVKFISPNPVGWDAKNVHDALCSCHGSS